MSPLILAFISILVLSICALATRALFSTIFTRLNKAREVSLNFSLVIFSISYLLVICELLFATFFVQSEGSNQTLVAQNWNKKYWAPINKLGYRDREHNWRGSKLFILGDSFIAGHGIKFIENRLSGFLSDKLGPTWDVAILAQNGWSTREQLDALQRHPQKPDRLVISYYLNDIAPAARQHGLERQQRLKAPKNIIIKYLLEKSHLFNWYYWNLRKWELSETNSDYFQRAFSNEDVWKTHKQDLIKLASTAKQYDENAYFIIWPILNDVETSIPITKKINQLLLEQNTNVINLSHLFTGRNSKELVVNRWDNHPNESVNSEVAQLLYRKLQPLK